MIWRMSRISVFYVTLSVVPTINSSVECSNLKSGERFIWLGPKFQIALACHVLGSLLCACNSRVPLATLPLMAPGRISRVEFIQLMWIYSVWMSGNIVIDLTRIVSQFLPTFINVFKEPHHIMKAHVSFNWELSDDIAMDNFQTHLVFHLFRGHAFICFSQHRDWHSL